MTGKAESTEPKPSVVDPAPPKTAPDSETPAPTSPSTQLTAESAPQAPVTEPEKPTTAAVVASAPETTTEKPAVSKRALVIDDEPANRDFLMRLLEQAGLEVHGAESGAEALKIAGDHEALALVVIDNKLPDMDGVDLLIKLRERYPVARMIMATMLDERALMTKAFENGCNVFLVKPHGFMELFRHLREFGTENDQLDRMIIDQYGLRPYRG